MVADLFKAKQAQNPVISTPLPTPVNEDTKREGETFVYYGTRICGKVTASIPALSAFLQKIYNAEKQRQFQNEEIQRQHKEELLDKISKTNDAINNAERDITNADHRINALNEDVLQLRDKLLEAKNKHGEVNKMAKAKLAIGLVILCILTVYLFIFYSSTFYSAFFKPFDGNISIGAAMFDAQALPRAFHDGFGELIFILCAPIIFMGLGYGLHFFMQQTSWTKYLKTASIVCITFVFDCILAYLIAEKIYNVEILTKLGEYPDFNISMAISDINVWAVIFCGFIVYIIWGIVFDMVMSAYEDLRSNTKEIISIEQSIQNKNEQILAEKQNHTNLKAEKNALEIKKQDLETKLNQSAHFNPHIIKTALNDFFSGWMTMMNGLSRPQSEQNDATRIYESTIQQLFK